MKYLLLFFLLHNFSQASVTGVTEGCSERAQLIANEGDKFVIIRMNGKDQKLSSITGAPFSLQAKDPVIFKSSDKNHKLGDASLEFEMTSMVMNILPRLTVSFSGIQKKCMVSINGPDDKK